MIQVPIGSVIPKTVVIADAGTKTPEIETGGCSLVGVALPASLEGTAMTFEASDVTGGTFLPVTKSDGSALTYTVASSKYVAIDPKDFYGIAFLKIVMGTAQTGAASLKITLKGI